MQNRMMRVTARCLTTLFALSFSLAALSSCASTPAVDKLSTAEYFVNYADTPIAAQPTPVATHGKLAINGNQLVDEHGNPVQLKGMSLFWSQWGGKYYTSGAIGQTRSVWNASVVRIAMGVESGGYLTNSAAEKQRVKDAVQVAKDLGIYAIIDWHDHNAHNHTTEAVAFFTEMANLYKDTPNVLFEIYNEPLDTVTWATVKQYAVAVVAAIRGTGAKNVIIVGSPSWSQNVNNAAASPITGYDNIAYTLHFYAASHGKWLRDRADAAMSSGIAIFVTEWGTCDASGNKNFDADESDAWLAWMDAKGLSWCNWSLFDKDETASALMPNASVSGPWAKSDLTESGLYVMYNMRKGGTFQQ